MRKSSELPQSAVAELVVTEPVKYTFFSVAGLAEAPDRMSAYSITFGSTSLPTDTHPLGVVNGMDAVVGTDTLDERAVVVAIGKESGPTPTRSFPCRRRSRSSGGLFLCPSSCSRPARDP